MMVLLDVADRVTKSILETYFQLRDKPFHGSLRFLYATLGSLSLFYSALLVREVKFDSDILELVPMKYALAIASVFFGFMISLAKTKHGPVRLYISGVLLPAFVVSVVRITWSIDVYNKVVEKAGST